MKTIIQTIFLVFLIVLLGKAQDRELVLKNICPTETATAIHAHLMLPFKMNLSVEEKKLSGNYRPSYIYHLIPSVSELKGNEVKLFMGGFSGDSDSTLVSLLLLDGYKKVEN